MANSNEGQDHKDKYFDTSRKILSQEMTCLYFVQYGSSSILFLRSYDECQFLKKISGQKTMTMSIKYQQKDIITRGIDVIYQSSYTHYSKVISKIKVFKK